MKKFLALSLSAALLLALLGACTSENPENTVNSPGPTAGASASVPPADNTQEPTPAPPSEEPTGEVSEKPSEEPSPTDSPTHHPEETHHVDPTHHPEETHHGTTTPTPTPAPTPTPTPAPTPTPKPVKVDLAVFYALLAEAYGFPAMDRLDPADELGAAMLDNFYAGLTDMDLEQVEIYPVKSSFSMAELALVEVKNTADVNAVKDIFQARVNAQASGGAWYPEPTEVWQNHSHIVSNGNFVMMIVHKHCDTIVTDFNAFIADPSYVPAPVPDSEDGNSGSGGTGGGGGLGPLIPLPNF